MIITIDGPAGSGKSSVARNLAARLQYDFLDTGAMYRIVAKKAMQSNLSLDDESAVADLAAQFHLSLKQSVLLLNDVPLGPEIRTAEVSLIASHVAKMPAIREQLVKWQRELARGKNIVSEGRDQGTVVFPHAEFKFFLTADPLIRAQRRFRDLQVAGNTVSESQVFKEQQLRDEQDTNRDIAPLKAADDAILIDTSSLELEQVVDQIEHIIQDR